MHELSHAVCCILGHVRIFKMKLFRFGNPAGYVEHAVPEGFFQSFIISFGPLIFNSLIALILFSRFNWSFFAWENVVILWLGVVIGLNAVPSMGDTEVLWKAAKKKIWKNPFVVIGFPFILFLFLLNLLKRWHIHFLYTAFLFWLGALYLKS